MSAVPLGDDLGIEAATDLKQHLAPHVAQPGPLVLDAGVYKPDVAYVRGDGVTWRGSLWIAQCDTSAEPEKSRDWRLAVKRGRDGKDGATGPRGEKGEPGKDGRDLTQIGLDGKKW